MLEDNIDILHKLADLLLEKETVMGSELHDLIMAMRPGIRLPSFHPPQEDGDIKDKEKADPDASGEATTLKEKATPKQAAADVPPETPDDGLDHQDERPEAE